MTDGAAKETTGSEGEPERVVVRDKRRLDPETGEKREAVPAEKVISDVPETGDQPGAVLVEENSELAERTADLQRVTAEYANYRRRVERDREATLQLAKASLANELLGVLDDIERAEAHGDLNGAFKAVADKLIGTLNRAGLESFGKTGEEFDPSVHEAVQHSTSTDVTGPTVTLVMRQGYRFGERVLRPALVGVTDHGTESDDE
ncbi:nucleotide exchange factor GrpE [Pseudonocardiaceae bacterium YIM PH 21723]|nr:nucleotide exchange factor GrpE [Pseudonocardiaceae bacterium YIM PH 21723]